MRLNAPPASEAAGAGPSGGGSSARDVVLTQPPGRDGQSQRVSQHKEAASLVGFKMSIQAALGRMDLETGGREASEEAAISCPTKFDEGLEVSLGTDLGTTKAHQPGGKHGETLG